MNNSKLTPRGLIDKTIQHLSISDGEGVASKTRHGWSERKTKERLSQSDIEGGTSHEAQQRTTRTRGKRHFSAPSQEDHNDLDVTVTPRGLVEAFVAGNQTAQMTKRKKSRIDATPSADFSPQKSPRRSKRKSMSEVLRKKATMRHFLQQDTKAAQQPTPRTMIAGLLGQASEETPVVAPRSSQQSNNSLLDSSLFPSQLNQDASNDHSGLENSTMQNDTFLTHYESAPQVRSSQGSQRVKAGRREVNVSKLMSQMKNRLEVARSQRNVANQQEMMSFSGLDSVYEETEEVEGSEGTTHDISSRSLGVHKQSMHDSTSATSLGEPVPTLLDIVDSQDKHTRDSTHISRSGHHLHEDQDVTNHEASPNRTTTEEINLRRRSSKHLDDNTSYAKTLADIGLNVSIPHLSGTSQLQNGSHVNESDHNDAENLMEPHEESYVGKDNEMMTRRSNEMIADRTPSAPKAFPSSTKHRSIDTEEDRDDASERQSDDEDGDKENEDHDAEKSEEEEERVQDSEGSKMEDEEEDDREEDLEEGIEEREKEEEEGEGSEVQGTEEPPADSTLVMESDVLPAQTPVVKNAFTMLMKTPVLPPHKSPGESLLVGRKKQVSPGDKMRKQLQQQIAKGTGQLATQAKANLRKPKKTSYLPRSLTKSIFSHFSKRKPSAQALDEIEKVAERYWKHTVGDLSVYAAHAKRKGIEEADLQLLMTRQRFASDRQSMYTLVEKYLPLEYREQIIPIARSGNILVPKT